MIRHPVSRVLSAAFIMLMGGGGGDLPALDGLLFHARDRVPTSVASHFEAAGGCHADQCAIRSTSQHSRFPSALPVSAVQWAGLESVEPAPPRVDLRPGLLSTQPFSRAPPVLSPV